MRKRAVGRPRGSRDRRGSARRVDGDALRFVVRSFGEQIRRAREDADVSAEELAAATGLHVGTIHHYEAARSRPSLRSLVAIAMALRVPVDHLVPES
jgi:ribosome-binding protein aMBF1 (putative translation factor)